MAAARREVAEEWVSATLVLVFALLTIVPWFPKELSSPVDFSWGVVLHQAFIEGWAFGRDIVFTYGPWGFLAYGFDPATWEIATSVWIVMVSTFSLALWRLCREVHSRLFGFVLTLLVLILIGGGGVEVILFAVVGTYLALASRAESRLDIVLVHLLAVFVALSAWIKFPLAILGLVVTSAILIGRSGPPRPGSRLVQWSALTWLGALVLWWLAAGQSVRHLIPFLSWSLELSRGYSEAMTIAASPSDDSPMPFLSAAALFNVGVVWAAIRRRFRALIVAAAWVLTAFIIFKGGFVRPDRLHTAIASGALLSTQIIYLLAARPQFERRMRFAWYATMGTGILISAALVSSYTTQGIAMMLGRTLIETPARARIIASGDIEDRLSRRLDSRLRTFIPEEGVGLEGTVDVFPRMAALPVAAGLDYEPRPVFQSYMTYTPRLAELNAAKLRSSGAQWILHEVAPLDDRLPSSEDSLGWLEMIRWYGVSDSIGPYLVLARREDPRNISLKPFARATVSLNEPVAVPPGMMVWVRIDVRPTLAGRLMTVLFRQPQVLLAWQRGGESRLHALPPSIARHGFLLVPLVDDQSAVRSLLSDRPVEVPVTPAHIRIGVSSRWASWLFDPEVRIEYDRLSLSP